MIRIPNHQKKVVNDKKKNVSCTHEFLRLTFLPVTGLDRVFCLTAAVSAAFPDESGRQAHLSGKVAAALMAKASELLAQPPVIENAEVLAVKLSA